MATAFTATLKFAGQDGASWSYYCTISDVTAENYVFPDGNGFINLPNNHGIVYLVDLITSTAGVDTRSAEIWVNGINTGLNVHNASCLYTNPSRQFWGAPLKFSPGARLQIIQRT